MGTDSSMYVIFFILFLLLLCGLVGWFGSTRKIGFWWSFSVSVVLTAVCILWIGEHDLSGAKMPFDSSIIMIFMGPIIVFLTSLCFKSKKKEQYEQDMLSALQQQTDSISTIGKTNQLTITEELEKLSNLWMEGHITEEEYQKLKNQLISRFD